MDDLIYYGKYLVIAGCILFVIAAVVLYFAFGNPILMDPLLDFLSRMISGGSPPM